MSDDEIQPQNPTSEENSLPTSPQEPTEHAPENTAYSALTEALPEAPESSPSDFEVKSNNIPPSNSSLSESEKDQKTEENPSENKLEIEPIPDQVQTPPEQQTPQIPVDEPLPASEPSTSEAKEESKPEIETLELEPEKEKTKLSYLKTQKLGELLILARSAMQVRKRKKLDRVMTLFAKRTSITNDEVEKFLHVSDATATRYLSILEKERKIKQSGKTGRSVSYLKI